MTLSVIRVDIEGTPFKITSFKNQCNEGSEPFKV
jgi:hypothetical protein